MAGDHWIYEAVGDLRDGQVIDPGHHHSIHER